MRASFAPGQGCSWTDGQSLATPSLPGWPKLREFLVVHGIDLTLEVLTYLTLMPWNRKGSYILSSSCVPGTAMRGVLPAQHNPERERETERERKKERETHTHAMDLHFKHGKLRLVVGVQSWDWSLGCSPRSVAWPCQRG